VRSDRRWLRGPRSSVAVRLVACLVVLLPAQLEAQELPLKTAVPPGSILLCDEREAVDGEEPSPEDREEAARLTNAATQTMILGDLDGALEFLNRATGTDPTAPEAVYLRARILQQQGAREGAVAALCEYLRLEPAGPSAEDARRRLDESRDLGVGRELVDLHERALALEFQGRLEEAEAVLTELLEARPDMTVALYNRGILRGALGRADDARADLARYLQLEPAASDEPEVRRFIERVPTVAVAQDRTGDGRAAEDGRGPRVGAIFVASALVPGAGQFYTGRPLLGAAVTGVAVTTLAAGALYRRTTVHCLDATASPCPSGQVASRETERPFMAPAIVVAAGLAVAAAVEAALHATRPSQLAGAPTADRLQAVTATVADRISYDGLALRLELARLDF
jgi:tetratricopeptide (TPR) repeat protein